MDDRELLELAAKAAGIEHPGGEHCLYGPALWDCQRLCWWRPLTDDGDALRLAVKLEMDVIIWEDYVSVFAREVPELDEYARGGCIYAVTRRAIVRAAAEIGWSMP